jgi:hypothetical protein
MSSRRISQPVSGCPLGMSRPGSGRGRRMQCEYGGEVTLTTCEQGYRLRIFSETTVSLILSRQDLVTLLKRGIELLLPEDE